MFVLTPLSGCYHVLNFQRRDSVLEWALCRLPLNSMQYSLYNVFYNHGSLVLYRNPEHFKKDSGNKSVFYTCETLWALTCWWSGHFVDFHGADCVCNGCYSCTFVLLEQRVSRLHYWWCFNVCLLWGGFATCWICKVDGLFKKDTLLMSLGQLLLELVLRNCGFLSVFATTAFVLL